MDDYLIRAELARKATHYEINGYKTAKVVLLKDVLEAPAADVKPVMRGKWIEFDEDSWECSNCGQLWTLNDGTPKENNMNFCPACGARMEDNQE